MNTPELKMQAACVKWLRNERPETRGLFFAVNNNSEHIGRAMIRKSIGTIAGVSDTIFLWKGKAYFIEFKTVKGRQSSEQKRWQKIVEDNGFNYYIVRSLDEFKNLINSIMGK